MPADQIAAATERSFGRWLEVQCDSGSSALDVRRTEQFATCTEATFDRGGSNVNTISFIDNWDELDYAPDAFALTTVFHDARTGKILDADMQINELLGPYGSCEDSGCPDQNGRPIVDLENVLTHEAGHFLGLGHSAEGDATMYGNSARGDITRRTLTDDDREGFCAMYPPGSLSESCDFTPHGGLGLDCRQPRVLLSECAVTGVGAGPPPDWAFPAVLALAGTLWCRRRNR